MWQEDTGVRELDVHTLAITLPTVSVSKINSSVIAISRPQ